MVKRQPLRYRPSTKTQRGTVMSNIVYTSYGFGGELHKGFENTEWAILQRYKISEYCAQHSIPLKVIDKENVWMKQILSNVERKRSPDNKAHAVYTLSAIAAVFDFCESDFENFYWLHLDMALNNDDINIFDLLDMRDHHIYVAAIHFKKADHDWWNTKESWLSAVMDNVNWCPKLGTEHERLLQTKINASLIFMNKKTALELRDIIVENFNFFSDDFSDSTYFIEETILEMANAVSETNNQRLRVKNWKEGVRANASCIPMAQNGNPTPSVFIHFWGAQKDEIPAYYDHKH